MAREVEKEDLELTSGILESKIYPDDDYIVPNVYNFEGEYIVAYSKEQAISFMSDMCDTTIEELSCEQLTQNQLDTMQFTEDVQQYDRTFAEELGDRLADEEVAPFYLGCNSDLM